MEERRQLCIEELKGSKRAGRSQKVRSVGGVVDQNPTSGQSSASIRVFANAVRERVGRNVQSSKNRGRLNFSYHRSVIFPYGFNLLVDFGFVSNLVGEEAAC